MYRSFPTLPQISVHDRRQGRARIGERQIAICDRPTAEQHGPSSRFPPHVAKKGHRRQRSPTETLDNEI